MVVVAGRVVEEAGEEDMEVKMVHQDLMLHQERLHQGLMLHQERLHQDLMLHQALEQHHQVLMLHQALEQLHQVLMQHQALEQIHQVLMLHQLHQVLMLHQLHQVLILLQLHQARMQHQALEATLDLGLSLITADQADLLPTMLHHKEAVDRVLDTVAAREDLAVDQEETREVPKEDLGVVM